MAHDAGQMAKYYLLIAINKAESVTSLVVVRLYADGLIRTS